jgi:hypothetical protein
MMTAAQLLEGAEKLRAEIGMHRISTLAIGNVILNAEAWGHGRRASMSRSATEKALQNMLEQIENKSLKFRS